MPVDDPAVRLQRLVLHAGTSDEVFSLDLHPGLTVFTGVGRFDRSGLASEILGALGTSRSGVHLELTDDDGRRLALFRPAGAPHRVLDIDRGVEVTQQFETGGEVDLLRAGGLLDDRSRRLLRVTGADLATEANRLEVLHQLAAVDDELLWTAAAALREVEAELSRFGPDGPTPLDAELLRLAGPDRAPTHRAGARGADQVRAASFAAAVSLALLGAVAAWWPTPVLALLFATAAAVLAAVAVAWRRPGGRAVAVEGVTPRGAGMSAYQAFRLHRLERCIADGDRRRQLLDLARAHERALVRWRAMAGDVDVHWAWRHRDAIRRRRGLDQPRLIAGPGELAATLAERFDLLATSPRMRPPIVLDEPFPGVTDDDLRDLISLLLVATSDLQLVLFTEDERIADWARLEALDGAIRHVALDGGRPTPAAPTGR